MKRLFFILFITISSIVIINAQAPNYVDWEWDILKFGLVEPTGGGLSSGGFETSTELRYNLSDIFSLGIALNGAFFGSDFGDNADVGVSGSFLVVGDYYLKSNSGTRAFVGAGFGRYSDGTIEIRNGNTGDVINGSSGLGLAPRVGFELGHGRLMAQYNLTFDKATTDYFGISLALTLWGGYKPK